MLLIFNATPAKHWVVRQLLDKRFVKELFCQGWASIWNLLALMMVTETSVFVCVCVCVRARACVSVCLLLCASVSVFTLHMKSFANFIPTASAGRSTW